MSKMAFAVGLLLFSQAVAFAVEMPQVFTGAISKPFADAATKVAAVIVRAPTAHYPT